ncbi:hypothetical protein C9374_010424 [Naegleria lovaniensis]|uniref:Hsp70-interacting protein N-terminal domain-containing protein n=1 Tax=Naegleria lovaniensis TaxID=51637 RepID=A0AA88GFT1_NAELO|nr:uncharacterized protein C9374_010424 [Naegleria lovaniensis]KAG2374680.1 hypothetical protein C9374_010424 [Naegleria lovaniensis]
MSQLHNTTSHLNVEPSSSNHKGVVFSASQLELLEKFVNYVKSNPQIIREREEFKFFRDFLIHDCGATKLITDQHHHKEDPNDRVQEESPMAITPKHSKPLILEVDHHSSQAENSSYNPQHQNNDVGLSNEPLLTPSQTKRLTNPPQVNSSSNLSTTTTSQPTILPPSNVNTKQEMDATISSPTLSLSDSKYLNNMNASPYVEFGNSSITKNVKLANEYTSKGNQLFKEKQYELAAIHYGKSIELQNGESAILFIKRAECMAMLNKPLSVRRDCDAAISLNPDAGKAYRLRAKAYIVLRKYEQARNDLEMSRKLEDDTSEATKLLKELEKVLPHGVMTSSTSSKPPTPEKKISNTSKSSTCQTSVPSSSSSSTLSNASNISSSNSKPTPTETTSQKPTIHTKPQPEPEPSNNNNVPNFVNPQVMKLVAQDETLMRGFQNPRIVNAINEIAVNPNAFMKYNNDPEVVTMFKKFTQIIANSK